MQIPLDGSEFVCIFSSKVLPVRENVRVPRHRLRQSCHCTTGKHRVEQGDSQLIFKAENDVAKLMKSCLSLSAE